jgi:hypothetical protein
MSPEEQAIHASIVEKLKPVFENKKPLTVNDLSAKTPENNLSVAIALSEGYGNEPFSSHSSVAKDTENLETLLEGLRKAFLQYHPLQSDNEINPNPTSNAAPLPENETPLIINDLSSKTPETTGNKPATPIDPLFVGYPTSSTPPDPTVPYTYFNGKMLLTKYPDGRIRYDYGGGRPAITITKGGPAILERRVFYI